jgi:hypothetical protein
MRYPTVARMIIYPLLLWNGRTNIGRIRVETGLLLQHALNVHDVQVPSRSISAVAFLRFLLFPSPGGPAASSDCFLLTLFYHAMHAASKCFMFSSSTPSISILSMYPTLSLPFPSSSIVLLTCFPFPKFR